MIPPSANVSDNAILYGELPEVSLVIGVELELPSFDESTAEVKNEFYAKWESFIGAIPQKYNLQFHSSIDGDYSQQIDYYADTGGQYQLDRHVRGVNLQRYQSAMDEGLLWNKRMRVYASSYLTLKGSQRNMISRLNGSEEAMAGFLRNLEPLVKAFGGSVRRLETSDLKSAIRDVLGGNPSKLIPELEVGEEEDFIAAAYPSATVNVDQGIIFHDGRYHRYLVLDEAPRSSYPHMCSDMLLTTHKDVSFTFLAQTEPKKTMLDDLEQRYNKLKRDEEKKPTLRGADDLEQLEGVIKELKHSSGGICKGALIIHLWANDLDTLAMRADEVRTNVSMSRGATLYEPGLAVETRRLFYSTLPGYHSDMIKPFVREFDPCLAARLLPMNASYKGEKETPMALYQGHGNSLVGLSLFRGGRPMHTAVFGSSGVGKSLFCNDLVTQHNPYLSRIFIVETGNSYGVTVGLLGGRTIELSVNGSQRLNLFDTFGAPLLPSHIDTISSILLAMMGDGVGAKYGRDQVQSVLARIAEEFMMVTLEDFKNEHPDLVKRGYAEAYLFHQYKLAYKGDFEEGALFWEFKQQLLDEQVEAIALNQIQDFRQNPDLATEAERYLFSLLESTDFEILEQFRDTVEHMQTDDRDTELRALLATLLDPWCGGIHGNLLNGHTNMDLTGRLVHLELEGLGENDALKNVVLGLLRIIAFQDVLAAPRAEKKLWLFEEMGSLSRSMGGLGEIVKTIAQTGRKYNLCLLTIVQQFEAYLAMEGMMEATVGNSQQFVIFKQATRSDLERLLEEVSLPSSLVSTIMDYPYPADLQDPKYGTALFATVTGTGWSLGTAMIHCPKAMVWAADSSGENFDSKMQTIHGEGGEEFINKLLNDEAVA